MAPEKLPPKLPRGSKIVLATHNSGKVVEMRDLMLPYGVETVSAADLGAPSAEETGTTFEENALIKARTVAAATNLPSLSDDSGFCVQALGGAPGIYSARWAKDGDFSHAMQKVHDEVSDATDRTSWFVCVLAIAWPNGPELTFRGEAWGDMVWPPRGRHGFGYDPIFQPAGHSMTFAEMPPASKDAMSHRAYAFRAFANNCLRG